MHTHADKTQKNKSQSVANEVAQKQGGSKPTFQFVDNRPETIAQRKRQDLGNNSPQVKQLKAFQEMANNRPQAKQAAQLKAMMDNYSSQQRRPIQKKENKTGLPDNLKSRIENLSGYSMDNVKVHYNSDKPAQLQAHAYAQGTDIHLASGQEKHLPHETWHIVQQKQGRVKPTMQMKGKINVNDDVGLEKEADVMGNSAINIPHITQLKKRILINKPITQSVVQTAKKKESGKEKFDRQMKEMNDLIESTNEKIQDVHKIKAQFAKDSSMTPMNPAVFLEEIHTTDALNISKNEARLANFSAMTKEFVNALQKGNVTPEIQIALVKSTIEAAETIYVSGNTSTANKKIGVSGSTVLGDYYQNNIRNISVKRRVAGLEKIAKSNLSTKASRSNFKKKIVITKGDKEADVAKKIARQLLTDNKRNPYRLSGTSARKFAKVHSKKRLQVPPNKKNIHAESAILISLKDTKNKIQEIGGTKVACLACQAFFTHLHEHKLLGENTGYAWVSKSSQEQLKLLIDTINTAEDYLINLAKILESRLSSLKRYTGPAGNKKVEEADSESDVENTDSEDEDALNDLEKSNPIREIAKALLDIS